MGVKIFLDDVRDPVTPFDFVVRNVDECIEELMTYKGNVDVLSLDHDLGNHPSGDGNEVLKWLLRQILNDNWDEDDLPTKISVHTANPVRRDEMNRMIQDIIAVADMKYQR